MACGNAPTAFGSLSTICAVVLITVCIAEDTSDTGFPFTCWVDDLEYFACCDPGYGPKGHSLCFNDVFTFDRCCIDQAPQIDAFSCWGISTEMSVDTCCSASSGPAPDHASCWDEFFTYDICCLRQEFELPSSRSDVSFASPTVMQLQQLEQDFGGLQTGIISQGCTTNQTGGDRMSRAFHNYAPCYSRLIAKMLSHWHDDLMNIAEVGILEGSGLALWSCVFPMAHLYGFDIDPSNAYKKLDFMKSRGGFAHSNPELITFDQLRPVLANQEIISKVLEGRELKLVIDDGLHSDTSIVNTFLAFSPYLSSDGIYIIEDLCNQGNQADRLPIVTIAGRKYATADPKQCWRKAQSLLNTVANQLGFELFRCIDSNMFVLIRSTYRMSVLEKS